ncbi:MAG: Asp-tRNA(Asn)/Glu-tRNA(Gln) amidotransferase subunit GatA [Cytophagales bacterium]|nr:Asp-tRNA(Asn)/Glu-tRNA(Gln) amidotransferase subunit GatA [Cytophagales bacterium]
MRLPTSFQSIRAALENGTLTCAQLVEHYLENIHERNDLNAFLEVFEDEARSKAAEIDEKLVSNTAGRLAGMVISIKDVLCYEDHNLQASSKILGGFESQFTATAVERLLAEDAIIIGRTNCDEFAMGSSNENSAFGPVLNAADRERVPGGSSGGAAVSVQADLCLVALGSDTGGSVRQPAAFCGVIGLKPTYSRISRHGLVAYASSFDSIGVFAKEVEDIARVLEVIAGEDDFDSTVSRHKVGHYSDNITAHTQNYKLAYVKETLESPGLSESIKTNILGHIEELKAAGHTVEQVNFPLLEHILPTYYILTWAEASSNLSRFDGVRYGYRSPNTTDLSSLYKKTRTEGFGEEVKRRIMLGTFVLSASYYDAYYTKAQKTRKLIRDQTKAILQEYDFIITPTTPTTAFKLGEHSQDPLEMYLADLYTVQPSVAGLPAISLPSGMDEKNLPIGLQVIADDFKEKELLKFSHYFLNLN